MRPNSNQDLLNITVCLVTTGYKNKENQLEIFNCASINSQNYMQVQLKEIVFNPLVSKGSPFDE